MQYAPSPPGWAINSAIRYFNLPKRAVDEIKWGNGVRKLMDMWAVDGYEMYDSPWYAVRQEWYHESIPIRRVPLFFEGLPKDTTVLDWGCGTGEICRKDWIEKGGKIILADIPGPNFEYLKYKFRGLANVTFWDANKPIDIPYDALVCMDVLEHIENPMRTIKKLWGGLDDGGNALLWFEDKFPHPGHLEKSIAKIPEYEKWLKRSSISVSSCDTFDWVMKPKSIKRRFYEFFH